MKPPDWLTNERFLVFDIETTGLDHSVDRIVQIATLQIDKSEIVHRWVSLVNPERPIPEAASNVHGIFDGAVREAQEFWRIAPIVAQLAAGRHLLGYNAAHFDAPFVRAEFLHAGKTISERYPVDALIWVREIDRYVPGQGRHRLEATCRRWNVPTLKAHDALSDCEATWRLFRTLVEERPGAFPRTIDEVLSAQRILGERQEKDRAQYLARQKEFSQP